MYLFIYIFSNSVISYGNPEFKKIFITNALKCNMILFLLNIIFEIANQESSLPGSRLRYPLNQIRETLLSIPGYIIHRREGGRMKERRILKGLEG